jgi:TolA-binding protein
MNSKILYVTAGLCLGLIIGYGYYNYFAGPPHAENKTKGPFGKGREAVCSGAYDQGLSFLEEYFHNYPNGRNAARAGLFRGKALLAKGEYEKSESAWKEVIHSYPNSLEAHKCKYKLGLIHIFTGDTLSALQQFQSVRSEKNGPLTAEAEAFVRWLSK